MKERILRPLGRSLDKLRRRLASTDALPSLALLALIAGTLTGGVIIVFHIAIEMGAKLFLNGDSDAFEELNALSRGLLVFSGATLIGITLNRYSQDRRRVGVVHVMERLSRHQGYLPPRNASIQFFAGAVALITGQSGGREGPAIHLGAASSSLLGQMFELPNNSIRTLVACGTAAAIAGSFNTPIAGVIFAMEVVMMEYTIASFIPVILASVTATVVTRSVFGDNVAFDVPPLDLKSLVELPYIVFGGLVVGTLAAVFIRSVQFFAGLTTLSFWMRASLAGLIAAGAAAISPAVLGIGYDTVNAALLGNILWPTLFIIVIAKTIASSAAVGLGLPVGLIGPTLVIGGALGGLLGYAGNLFMPAESSSSGFYVMLGMSAMMAAVLQAPLAALMAVLELTANPNIILPAMLIIVVATLTTSQVYKQKSVFLTTLSTLGLEYPPTPASQHLQRAGVAGLMHRDFVRLSQDIEPDAARDALTAQPRWIVVENDSGDALCLLNATDLKTHLDVLDEEAAVAAENLSTAEDAPEDEPETTEEEPPEDAPPTPEKIALMNVPAMRKDVADVDIRVTLLEALNKLDTTGVEALCVRRTSAPLITPIMGVLTREDIETFSQFSGRNS